MLCGHGMSVAMSGKWDLAALHEGRHKEKGARQGRGAQADDVQTRMTEEVKERGAAHV